MSREAARSETKAQMNVRRIEEFKIRIDKLHRIEALSRGKPEGSWGQAGKRACVRTVHLSD